MDIVKCHYTETFNASFQLLNNSGLFIADNINTHRSETAEFINHLQKLDGISVEIINIGNGLVKIAKSELI